jgi:acyl carrier protein
MTETAILDGLESIAKQHLSYEGPLPLDASIVDTLKLDSIRMLTLVVEVENRFKVCLEEADESSIETLRDLVHVVMRLTDART